MLNSSVYMSLSWWEPILDMSTVYQACKRIVGVSCDTPGSIPPCQFCSIIIRLTHWWVRIDFITHGTAIRKLLIPLIWYYVCSTGTAKPARRMFIAVYVRGGSHILDPLSICKRKRFVVIPAIGTRFRCAVHCPT